MSDDPADRMRALCSDLEDEHRALDAVVAGLDEQAWSMPTPADGWSVRDQISHLAFCDHNAVLALTDPDAFATHADDLRARFEAGQPTGDVDLGRSVTSPELLAAWREARQVLLDAARRADPGERVPWYALPMGLPSFVSARLMETWAHGQDIVDAVGAAPIVSDRLRHVCHVGATARPYAFFVNEVPDSGNPIRVEVAAPGGATWTWGPEDATDRVIGDALDLALVVTQRRHPDDTDLVVVGATAKAWIAIAQSFAGPSGGGRPPGLGRVDGKRAEGARE